MNILEKTYWRTHYFIKDLIEEIEWHLQRADRGYGDIDTWNFDEYVARLIKENCFRIASNFHGCPDKLTEQEWKQILLDISFGFGSYLEMRSGYYDFEDAEYKRLNKEYKKGLTLFTKYHNYLWD